MLKTLRVGTKIGLGYALLTLILVAAVGFTILRTGQIAEQTDRLSNVHSPTFEGSLRLLNGVNHASAAQRGWILFTGDPKFKESRNQAWSVDIDPALVDLRKLSPAWENPEHRLQFREIERVTGEIRRYQQDIEGLNPATDNAQMLKIIKDETAPRVFDIREKLYRILDEQRLQVTTARQDAERLIGGLLNAEWILLAAGILISTLLAVFITRGITGPLLGLVESAAAIAKGDLTRPELPESADEPGRLAASFNLMAQSLRKVLTEAKQTTGEVSAATRQISAAAQQQVTSMTQSVASVNEITATAEEFKTTIQEFADRAKTVGEAADETAKRAGEGRALSQACAEKTDQVRANAEAAGESVLALAEQMQKISEITAAVNEIAEQTKLLALNASIEAARAGEEGRGFAVVATQVRELANQSKEAAGRISATIGAAQRSMQGVVGKIEEAGRLSGDSAEGVQKMAGGFQEIAAAIAQTTQAMKQIAAGAKQQEAGIGELAGGIAQIDSGAKQSLASAQQTLKSIQMIEQRSQTLNSAMATFKTA